MHGPSSLGNLLFEGAPIVRLFHAALDRDPTAAELEAGRRLVRESGSLVPLAASLATSREFRRLHGWSGEAGTLAEMAFSPAMRVALLPGLCPGMPPDEPEAYDLWVRLYDQPDQAALEAMPRHAGPPIAIAIAIGDTEAEAALATIASLHAQIHPHWTLHAATRLHAEWPRAALAPALAGPHVFARACEGDDPMLASIRACIAHAGEDGWVAILEPGDLLAPTALHEAAGLIAARPDLAMLRTDEDVVDVDGKRRLPRFKPAYSPLTDDPVGQLAVYRASLLQAVLARDDAAAHPFRAIASDAARLAGEHLVHHPAILCHRRSSRVEPHRAMSRAVSPPALSVTIIVPTRDRADLLARCTDGILRRTSYPSIELLIVDNGSTEPEALRLIDTLAADRRVRVLRVPGPFNFAGLNNAAAEAATGDLLVLLNNDVEIRDGDWLRALEGMARRTEIGVAGARLLYPDGTLQHAGILLGPGGAATHVGRHFPADEPGYLGRFERVTELSAVTGACLAIRREVWRRVGGMDERLAVTFNDVDLCLRVRAAGLRVVWTPHATLVHHEAQSRGLESEDMAKRERFAREQAILVSTWGDAVEADPFLNANLLAVPSGHLVPTRPRAPRPWPPNDCPVMTRQPAVTAASANQRGRVDRPPE